MLSTGATRALQEHRVGRGHEKHQNNYRHFKSLLFSTLDVHLRLCVIVFELLSLLFSLKCFFFRLFCFLFCYIFLCFGLVWETSIRSLPYLIFTKLNQMKERTNVNYLIVSEWISYWNNSICFSSFLAMKLFPDAALAFFFSPLLFVLIDVWWYRLRLLLFAFSESLIDSVFRALICMHSSYCNAIQINMESSKLNKSPRAWYEWAISRVTFWFTHESCLATVRRLISAFASII